jgi:hypothetical protein
VVVAEIAAPPYFAGFVADPVVPQMSASWTDPVDPAYHIAVYNNAIYEVTLVDGHWHGAYSEQGAWIFTAIPEPSALTILGLGAVALVLGKRATGGGKRRGGPAESGH